MTHVNFLFYRCRSGDLVWGGMVYLERQEPAFKKTTQSTSGIVSSGSFMCLFLNPLLQCACLGSLKTHGLVFV